MDMPETNINEIKAELMAAKVKGVARELKEPIPVIAKLDNGEVYKGFAFEVRPDGLVMVQTGNCDLGVQLSTISIN